MSKLLPLLSRLKDMWRRQTTAGLGYSPPYSKMVRVVFLNNVLLVGFAVGIVFAIINYYSGNYATAVYETVFALALGLNAMFLRYLKNYLLSVNIALLSFLVLAVSLLITGGIAGTGVYWVLIFPIAAFFLGGRKLGLLWVSLLLLSVFSLMLAANADIISIHYSFIEMRQFAISAAILTGVVYAYEQASSQNRKMISRRTKDLVKSYERAKKEAKAKEETQEELERVLREAEKRNVHLERTKLAITNLLEDLQAEKEKIQELSLKDETLLKSVGEGLIATNQKGDIIRVSDSMQEMLNRDASELVDIRITDAFNAYTLDGAKILSDDRVELKALESGDTKKERYKIERSDGSKFYALVTAAPYRIRGTLSGAVITVRDITTETEIDQAKSEFVSLASHQLRTPLTAINWYAEMMLQDDFDMPEEMREYLEEIHGANRRMVGLVNALLNVSRIDLGTFMIDPKPIDIHTIVKTTIKELKESINEKDITVSLKLDNRIEELKLDPKLVYIIFQNLITNAVKYSEEGGKVWVRTIKEEESVRIEVEDNGYGIPKHQQDKVFAKLFRADNVLKQETDGTGLGLYITKAIIEESGGKITFESTEGKGTTFIVTFPLSGMKERKGAKVLSSV